MPSSKPVRRATTAPAPKSSSPVFRPGPDARTVREADGTLKPIPSGWELLPPGDPMWTRRVKAHGLHWVLQEKVGRKLFSRGVLAPASTIAEIKRGIDAERATEKHSQGLEKAAQRRAVQQSDYVDTFERTVLEFLDFAPQYASLARGLAQAVTAHATPVGSGTVARTERIPVEQRAESAVIAWMRHQTTAYDQLRIPREKGARREVRRMLAARSRQLLEAYRQGLTSPNHCPLKRALDGVPPKAHAEKFSA
jgi:hypothetical protein